MSMYKSKFHQISICRNVGASRNKMLNQNMFSLTKMTKCPTLHSWIRKISWKLNLSTAEELRSKGSINLLLAVHAPSYVSSEVAIYGLLRVVSGASLVLSPDPCHVHEVGIFHTSPYSHFQTELGLRISRLHFELAAQSQVSCH